MQTLIWKSLSPARQAEALTRPALSDEADIGTVVREIIAAVRARGDEALRELSQRFERAPREQLRVSEAEIDAACAEVRAMPAGDHPMLALFADEVRRRCATVKANLRSVAGDDPDGDADGNRAYRGEGIAADGGLDHG